jgi:Arc/MetJ family transcription regulator
MAKKLVDIDEQVLAEAAEALGARTMKETVNLALAEVVRLSARREHAARLATMEGLDLDDPAVMGGAWR